MRGPGGEGKWPRLGAGAGAAGAMEGVLYKWTNYLSGESGAPQGRVLCLSGRRVAPGVGVAVLPETREAARTGRAVLSQDPVTRAVRTQPPIGAG